jgi:hypothetical protein
MTICANRLGGFLDDYDVGDAIKHEFQHYADFCEDISQGKDCKSMLCSELRAAYAQGVCSNKSDRSNCWRLYIKQYLQRYDECKGVSEESARDYIVGTDKKPSPCSLDKLMPY